jgi:hypothetical protein
MIVMKSRDEMTKLLNVKNPKWKWIIENWNIYILFIKIVKEQR